MYCSQLVGEIEFLCCKAYTYTIQWSSETLAAHSSARRLLTALHLTNATVQVEPQGKVTEWQCDELQGWNVTGSM